MTFDPREIIANVTEGSDQPIAVACLLTPEEFRARRDELWPAIIRRADITPLDNGYELRFASASDLVGQLHEVIDLERACCPFLTFHLHEDADGEVRLTLTGPPGTREFLTSVFAP